MAFQCGNLIYGTGYYGVTTPNWNLLDADISTTLKLYDALVAFPKPFSGIPALLVSLRGFHIMGREQRLFVGATSVTSTGFHIQITTYGDTRVKGVSATWIAYDANSAL